MAVSVPAIFFSEVLQRGFNFNPDSSKVFPYQKILFNTAQVVLSVAVSAVIFRAVGGHSPPFLGAYDYLPPVLAFLVFLLVNISLVSGIISLSEGESFFY